MTHMLDHKVHGYCLCLCEECVSILIDGDKDAESVCHCPLGCACHRATPKLPPAYYREDVAPPTHNCKDCGKEVVRKGNRGRYPSLCRECKA